MTTHGITVDQLEDGHALILGTTGSGKTYQLRGMLERLRRADRRVGAVDKLGNHWGLTLAADGQAPGLDFVIFGGKRGHIPMTPGDGEKVATLFIERNIPAIFDVSQWHADDQQDWVTAFAETVFRLNQEQPLHLSFDEAQSWVPQGGGGDAFRAVRLLAEQGRGNGIQLLLSCQRLSRLDATVREMMHTVVVMRQTGSIDRKAVRDLISADAEQGRMLEAELPHLSVGTGFAWKTGGGTLRKISFPPNTTFDSSRTPRHGDTPPAPIANTSALVEELRAALAPPPPSDPSIPTDPEAAYAVGTAAGAMLIEREAKIAELEAAWKRDSLKLIAQTKRIAKLERINEMLRSRLVRLTGAADAFVAAVRLIDAELESDQLPPAEAAPERLDDLGSVQDGLNKCPRTGTEAPRLVGSARTSTETDVTVGETAPLASKVDSLEGSARAQGIRGMIALQVLVSAASSDGLTEEQWAFLSGFARSGGTWTTYRGALRSAELIVQIDGRWMPTRAGYIAASDVPIDPPALGAVLVRAWAKKGQSTGKLAEVLLKTWPEAVSRAELASEAGMTASGGTFTTYLGRLRKRGMIEESGKMVRLNPALMEWQ